ncbi:thymidine phosphorylase [Spiroplasma chrysopicola]|uniref:Thymidine phosphorylase n=1 Tax=Spiroplasma chrysopicola DF-1 TaxID=1276227 RepID=R4UFL1_9MOLU|nr:thymidine phosphorylase [Spiroplasma chrysopicola]AGM24950.1 thymidine phosphorylase [Spiroplasma chrysopicola DF-1]
MDILNFIEKKKNGQELTKEEIHYLISEYTNGIIPDYQMAAFLMAVYFQSMSAKEIFYLTEAMVNSGETYDLSQIPGFKVDKHSSGGVGDKVSLIYGPLVASFGLKVAKISGRGFGHTGGTIDKLESFPGFKTNFTFDEFVKIIEKTNMSIISQSQEIVPADKKIYQLRDVTGTSDSLPLIASSVMCKKIATGSDGIVLDVKSGSGALLKSNSEARELAQIMIELGLDFNKKVAVIITNMSQPLGHTIGNLIEIFEVLEVLQGRGPQDLIYISCKVAALSLCQGGIFDNLDEAFAACETRLKTPEPLNYFKAFIKEQGGDLSIIENITTIENLLKVSNVIEIKAKQDGYLEIFNTSELGFLASRLGAGRSEMTDEIDHGAGIYLNKKHGDVVKKDEVIMTLYTNRYPTQVIYEWPDKIYRIVEKAPKEQELIYDIIQ